MLPLFIDMTSSNPNSVIARYNILESVGYDIGMVFVNTSLETAIERVEGRKRKVSKEVIMNYYNQIKKTKGFLRNKFPFFMEADNDYGKLDDKAVLKAFKKVSMFYTSPISNPIGEGFLKEMRENGWKYLVPNIYKEGELKNIISLWYRSTSK